MNVEDFIKQTDPRRRRSILTPFLGDIQQLRAAGYSLEQVRAFLASNSVAISVAGLSAYLRRVEGKGISPADVPVAAQAPAPLRPASAPKTPPTAAPAAPIAAPRRQFSAPPDPMDAVRRARQLLAEGTPAPSPSPQGDTNEDRRPE